MQDFVHQQYGRLRDENGQLTDSLLDLIKQGAGSLGIFSGFRVQERAPWHGLVVGVWGLRV